MTALARRERCVPRKQRPVTAVVERRTGYGAWHQQRQSKAARDRQELAEDIEWMMRTGESVEMMAVRTGKTIQALDVALRRMGRRDLAAPFTKAAQKNRSNSV